MFSLKDKVALVTGSGSGLGLEYVKEMLRNGLRGATIADLDPAKGEQALREITREFGPNKAIFQKTDVAIQKEVEAAFKKTIEIFKNLDVVINNAGLLNDGVWEKQLSVNINGTIYGIILAWDYLPKYRSGDEAVVVNISSIAGLTGFMSVPVYAASKHAIVGLSRSLGVQDHYDSTKIRVLTICPGVTDTPLITELTPNFCVEQFRHVYPRDVEKWPMQKPAIVAKGMIQAITTGANGSFWIINDGEIKSLSGMPEVLDLPK